MLIRYVDGPYKGDTVETTCLEIEGTFIEDGAAWQVRYRVDRPNFTAREVWRAPLGSLDPAMLDPGPEPLTLEDASTEQVPRGAQAARGRRGSGRGRLPTTGDEHADGR